MLMEPRCAEVVAPERLQQEPIELQRLVDRQVVPLRAVQLVDAWRDLREHLRLAVARTSTPRRSSGFGNLSARPARSNRSTSRVVSEARLSRPSAMAPIGRPSSSVGGVKHSTQSATY